MSAWTYDKPTEPGWYWMKRQGYAPYPCRVGELAGELSAFYADGKAAGLVHGHPQFRPQWWPEKLDAPPGYVTDNEFALDEMRARRCNYDEAIARLEALVAKEKAR